MWPTGLVWVKETTPSGCYACVEEVSWTGPADWTAVLDDAYDEVAVRVCLPAGGLVSVSCVVKVVADCGSEADSWLGPETEW